MRKLAGIALLGLALCSSSCRHVLHHVVDDMVDHAIDEVLQGDCEAPVRVVEKRSDDRHLCGKHFGPCPAACRGR